MQKAICNLMLIAAGFTLLFGCTPGGKLTQASKNPQCSAELIQALKLFSEKKGLHYQVSPSDPEILFNQGTLQKTYGRDGKEITSYFGFEKEGKQCRLKLYKMATSGPGESTSSTGDYGSVGLESCKCQ
ncbi:hypothetical protein [Dongshaea marina]|uniref:hypothetical protein n=1 Tax=Dongshaea marina TaxID=2047966 RepID=UPI000D3E0FDD|nr:hypothetical protein [Dongshaea marina]